MSGKPQIDPLTSIAKSLAMLAENSRQLPVIAQNLEKLNQTFDQLSLCVEQPSDPHAPWVLHMDIGNVFSHPLEGDLGSALEGFLDRAKRTHELENLVKELKAEQAEFNRKWNELRDSSPNWAPFYQQKN